MTYEADRRRRELHFKILRAIDGFFLRFTLTILVFLLGGLAPIVAVFEFFTSTERKKKRDKR